MTHKEKAVLKELKEFSSGCFDYLYINQHGYNGTIQKLRAGGLVESFEYKNLLCYRATTRGYLVFEPFWKRAWIFFTDDLAKILSVVATILSIISILITLLKK